MKLDSRQSISTFDNRISPRSLGTLDLFSPNGVLLGTEANTDPSSSDIPFYYNETITNSSNFELANNEDFTVTPVEADTMAVLNGSVSTLVDSVAYDVETSTVGNTDYVLPSRTQQGVRALFLLPMKNSYAYQSKNSKMERRDQ